MSHLELIRDLPDGVDGFDEFGVACHEIGHALQAEINDITIDMAVLEHTWFGFGDVSGGETIVDWDRYDLPDFDNDPDGVMRFAEVYAAGVQADALALVAFAGWDWDQAIVHEMPGARTDYQQLKSIKKYLPCSIRDLEKSTRRMVTKHSERIFTLAASLATKNRLAGKKITV